VPRRIVNDEPGNQCFGCSPSNPRGLQLVFDELAPGEIELRYEVPDELCGNTGIAHGGIQAALLDEVMGMAVRGADEAKAALVTAEFQLRYRRPVPTGAPLVLRASVLRSEPPDHWVEAGIFSLEGELLTRAEARWRRIR
jgi:uncharacterized protein (TIGR00369 family)